MNAVEIFVGAGGSALGTAQAGFQHLALIEADKYACQTIRSNGILGKLRPKKAILHETDVAEFDYSSVSKKVGLLVAGLPCQPFSLGGKGMAHRDKRDMFAEVVRAARELRPQAILIENVKGLLRTTFKDYFDYLLLALSSPSLARGRSQTWRDHLVYLQGRKQSEDLRYDIYVHLVNAADYGIPQWRDRVLIVAFRSDLHVSWRAPSPTHSLDSLLWSQWRTGEYWRKYGLHRKRLGFASGRVAARLQSVMKMEKLAEKFLPWRTVRDAIHDLPSPTFDPESALVPNHYVNPGARSYEGHNGSLLDEPAKTIKAGDHGVPGGENSLALQSGRVRYFSVRECARLQTFPDDVQIAGPWTRAMRQVGNAVPVELARVFAKQISKQLDQSNQAPAR